MEGQSVEAGAARSYAVEHRWTGEVEGERSWPGQRVGQWWHERYWDEKQIAVVAGVVCWSSCRWRQPTCSRRCDAPTTVEEQQPWARFATVATAAGGGRVVWVSCSSCFVHLGHEGRVEGIVSQSLGKCVESKFGSVIVQASASCEHTPRTTLGLCQVELFFCHLTPSTTSTTPSSFPSKCPPT